MATISIVKSTKCEIKFKVYEDVYKKQPVNLSKYIDFVCSVTDNGRLLIEKKFSTNDILIVTDNDKYSPYIILVNFKPSDTENLNINPPTEEKRRTIEIFGINSKLEPERFLIADFYLEGSGHYVYRNRN